MDIHRGKISYKQKQARQLSGSGARKEGIGMEMVSAKYARKWYDIGTQYADYSSNKDAIKAAYSDGHVVDCWESAGAFNAGRTGLPFEIKTFKRYGSIPVGSDGYAVPSNNFRDGEPERGVSTADDEWESSFAGQISKARRVREVVYFEGLQVGYGSDGEPVVLPVRD